MSAVYDNSAEERYELEAGGETAIAAYRREGDVIVFTHTLVPDALRGEGIASRLIAGALADVRAKGLKIRPLCQFVASFIAHHPEEADLVAK